MARILIIDDEAPVRRLLRHMLEKEGYEVIDAPDGEVGIKLFRERPSDLVLTDILMPEKEGIETIIELRKSFPRVKIIAMSGGGRMGKLDVLPIAKSFGALQTLEKPFERHELLDAIRVALA